MPRATPSLPLKTSPALRFDDTLIGDTADNVLEGAAGADVLDGGDGLDTVAYTHSNAAITVHIS